jgi:hypothetical protein
LLPPGDIALRHDIQLLADAGLIQAPAMTWPMSWPDLARAAVLREDIDIRALEASWLRVQAAARRASRGGSTPLRAGVAGAKQPTALRGFASTPREEAEASLEASWLGNRLAANLSVTAVADADDSQDVRLDGSYVAVTFGNWLLTAGSVERWWGPGWEGSLILSNNARPMPGVAFERLYADAWRSWLLRWMGPWRASISMNQLEGSDVAVPDTRFFAARVDFRPRPWLEIGLSRSAQWCGEGRPCSLRTFGDLLLGRDNRDASLPIEREPGNQMAGYDVRLASPWRALRAAAYAQLIGEDEAGGLPSKLLGLTGLEVWGGTSWGSYRMFAEYADTTCNFARRRPLFNCAYRNELYPQGYTFRERAIGHALDADGRMLAIGGVLVRTNGASWTLRARRIELNRGGAVPAAGHTLSPARDELRNLELQYNRAFAWGELGLGAGLDDFQGPSNNGADLRGFLQWRQGY